MGRNASWCFRLTSFPPGEDIGQYLDKLGLKLAPLPPVAATVLPGKPAEQAGMKGGDRILSINGHAVAGYEDFQELIPPGGGQVADLERDRRARRQDAAAVDHRPHGVAGRPAEQMGDRRVFARAGAGCAPLRAAEGHGCFVADHLEQHDRTPST